MPLGFLCVTGFFLCSLRTSYRGGSRREGGRAPRRPAGGDARLEADVHERPGRAGRPAHAPATARPIQVSVAVASSGLIARIWKDRLTYTNDQAKVSKNIATGRM